MQAADAWQGNLELFQELNISKEDFLWALECVSTRAFFKMADGVKVSDSFFFSQTRSVFSVDDTMLLVFSVVRNSFRSFNLQIRKIGKKYILDLDRPAIPMLIHPSKTKTTPYTRLALPVSQVGMMCPFADMANHVTFPSADFSIDYAAGTYRLQRRTVAGPMKKGDEVFISYGTKLDNVDLLVKCV